jgi:Protein of unknown function (DUF3071)
VAEEDSRDLRLVGKSEDGVHLNLEDHEGNSFSLRISDNLKSLVNAPRLSSVTPVDERPSYTVKDIQNRLRSGESMDSITRTTDWPIEKIEKFAGPILQERAYIIESALKSKVNKDQNSPTLAEITSKQLLEHGANLEEVEWNTYRNIDGSWNLVVHYPTRTGVSQANWNFDLNNRAIDPVDDAASWLIGEGKIEKPKVPTNGFIAPTDPPRLVSVKEEIHIRETIVDEDFVEELAIDFEEESNSKSDGVTSRPKLPSWDDIMFGSNKPTEE